MFPPGVRNPEIECAERGGAGAVGMPFARAVLIRSHDILAEAIMK